MVKRRHVFYVGGYDAQGAEGYYRLFVRESKRFLKVWPIELHVGDLKIDSDDLAYWNIEAAGPNWQVAIRYEFLRLEHFLRANLAQPLTRQLARAAWWAVDDLITGALWRISRSSWRFALHLAYLQLMLVLWIAMAAAGGSLAAVLTMHFVNLPTPITAVITLVAGVAILMLLRPLADRWFILQVANCWPYVREFARGKPTGYDRPIDILAARIVAAASANEADELVVIGHSSGGAIGAAVVARALEFDSDLFQHRPRLVLMTLGSLLPALTLHPAAHRLRGAVRRLAMERSLVWVDCQSRKDWLNFWRVDPLEASGVELGQRRCSLRIWQVRFRDMLSPDSIRRMQWNLLRMHYQFIMANEARSPYDFFMLVCGPASVTVRWAWRLARDPLVTTRHCLDAFGPFVMLAEVLPFKPPFIRSARPVLLRVPLVLSAGATFHRELLSDPATWRGVSLLPGGPKNSAARRMSLGLTRMTGDAHAHYRKMLVAPLRKASVDALAAGMARLAEIEAESWPVGEIIDLWERTRRLMQRLAVELLFGDTSGQGNLIADRVSRLMTAKWSLRPFAPINLPITSYGRMLREAELLEHDLLEWARNKRGVLDGRDLASIVVNSPDADGCPLDDAATAGQMPSLFAAASEASQTVLTWTLLLLALHPRVARELLDELRNKLGAVPSFDSIGDLSYLDAVVKESMRIIPPVPMQMRVAQRDTTIAGHFLPNGTRVILNTFLTNRMRDLYPEGDVFRPERWFTIAPGAFEFPVFSGGPYSCPGYWFGSTSVKIALASILTRYRMTLAPGARIDYRVQPTMRPLQSLRVLLHRQDGAFAATPVTGKIRNLISLPH